MVKPIFGNTTADNKKEKINTDKEENTLITNKPSLSNIPLKSCRIKSCSEIFTRDLDTKKNSCSVQESVQICQTLVSPKTLLNGATMPLGGRPVTAKAVTNISSLVMRNCPSLHNSNNNNSLVLCSTTVGCLSNQPQLNQPSKTGATVGLLEDEEGAEFLLVETEDRCGSYDDVVLEGDDEVVSETERECDIDYASDVDSGCYVWEEPDNTHSPGGQVTLSDKMRETMSVDNNFKPQEVTSEPAMMSLSTKTMRSRVNMCNRFNEIRQHSAISEPYFAVPKTVTQDSKLNQHKTGLKTSLQGQEQSRGPHKNSKTNTPFPFRHKPFMPEKTSTPNSSFARPKAVVTQHTNRKAAPKSSFNIYTDPAKPSRPSSGGSFCTSKDVLSSLSVNTLSPRTNCSSVSVSVKGGPRITSPLCSCGRRAKRQVVSNGGPNHGRGFYCCPVRRSGSGGRVQKGCEFFKWESALIKSSSMASAAVGSSVSLCHTNSSLSCRPPQRSTIRKSY